MGNPQHALWVWVCGPFAADSPQQRADNLKALQLAAKTVFDAGHIPVVGIFNALPLIEVSGGDPQSHEIRQPLSKALMQRCDVCLRIGGSSSGADQEVQWFREQGKGVLARPEYDQNLIQALHSFILPR